MKRISFFILLLFALFSCTKNNQIESSKIFLQENFVNVSEAREITGGIIFPAKHNIPSIKSSTPSVKTIEDIHEFKNKKNAASFYVINYNEGGFVILSADRRTMPVLAFSEQNKFIINENQYPEGLQFWIWDANEQISVIQNSTIQQSEKEKLAWKNVRFSIMPESNPSNFSPPGEDCYEHTVIETEGPIIGSIWDQRNGFEGDLPFILCGGFNFQVYAGCVPIAMGQVMKYYEYPTTYNWSQIPLSNATTTSASLIKDIHTAINTTYYDQPIYNCFGTFVSATSDMGTVLKNQFGYSSATFANYDENAVKNNITNGLPVILAGDNGSDGHMWVCEGSRSTTYWFDDCLGNTYFHFYMNWGWGGTYNDWFLYGNFNPSNTNYNNNKKMIYNIYP